MRPKEHNFAYIDGANLHKGIKELGWQLDYTKLRVAVTNLMKDMGYGQGYEKYTLDDLLPDELRGKKYFTLKSKKW
jgi:replication-associated recombination protein RarA